jgi:hypothetical protein
MNIELNDYGFIFDTARVYVAIDYLMLIIITALFIGFKAYKRFKAVK